MRGAGEAARQQKFPSVVAVKICRDGFAEETDKKYKLTSKMVSHDGSGREESEAV